MPNDARRPRPHRRPHLHRRRREAPGPQALAVRGGRIVAVGGDREVDAAASGPRRASSTSAGGPSRPGFGDAHVHPISSGVDALHCDLIGRQRHRRVPASGSPTYAAANPDLPWILGGGWYARPLPGRPRRAARTSTASSPIARCSCPTGTATTRGSTAAALELAGHHRRHPRPRTTAGSPATRTGRRWARSTRARRTWSERLIPPTTRRRAPSGRSSRARRYLHGLGITNWQDAIVDARDHATYLLGRRPRRADGAGRRGAVVGARRRARADRGRSSRDAPKARWAGTRATSVKLMLDGIVENWTAAMVDPYFDARRRADRQPGHGLHRPRGPQRGASSRLDALGFQPHFHALGDRAVRLGARRRRGRPRRRTAGPTRARTSPTSSSSTPTTSRASAGSARWPTSQPLWAVHEGQMDELTLPVPRARWPAPASTRSARCAATARRSSMGSDWCVSTRRPVRADGHRGQPRDRGRPEPGASGRAPFMPEEAIELADALTAFTAGSAYANHLDEAGMLAVGPAGGPRDPRPRPVRPRRRRRSPRRASSRRSSAARPCTRRPRSRAEPPPLAHGPAPTSGSAG